MVGLCCGDVVLHKGIGKAERESWDLDVEKAWCLMWCQMLWQAGIKFTQENPNVSVLVESKGRTRWMQIIQI